MDIPEGSALIYHSRVGECGMSGCLGHVLQVVEPEPLYRPVSQFVKGSLQARGPDRRRA